MNNSEALVTVKIINPIKSFNWFRDGFSLFSRKIWLFLLISGICLAFIGLAFFLTPSLGKNFVTLTIASVLINIIFPLVLTCLISTSLLLEKGLKITPRLIISSIWQAHALRMILIYLALALLIFFGSSYLTLRFPNVADQIEYFFEILVIILQSVCLIAIPANLIAEGAVQPMKMLVVSFKAFVLNIVSFLSFTVIVIMILMAIIMLSRLLSSVLGVWIFTLYVVELWIFATWLALCAIPMARSMLEFGNKE